VLLDDAVPEGPTILRFWHLLERHRLSEQFCRALDRIR
jgi:hypothetical protein